MALVVISGKSVEVPHLLVGSESVSVEPSGRLTLPARWRSKFEDGSAYTAFANMGTITHRILFPADNFEAILAGTRSARVRDALSRSSNEVRVDKQHRLSLFGEAEEIPGRVALLGGSSHIKIVSMEIAEAWAVADAAILGDALSGQDGSDF